MNEKVAFTPFYRIGIPVAALATLLWLTIGQQLFLTTYWPELVLATSLVLWLAHYRLRLAHYEVPLFHPLTLTLGIAIGIPQALLSLTTGITLYLFVDLINQRKNLGNSVAWSSIFWFWIGIWSRELLANGLGLTFYLLAGGNLTSGSRSLPSFWPFIALVFGFSIVYLLLYWSSPEDDPTFRKGRTETSRLITITLGPMPVILLAAIAYSFLGLASYILYILILAVAAPVFHSLIRMELQLRQRAENLGLLSDLSTSIQTSRNPKEVSNLILNTSIAIGCGERAILELGKKDEGQFEIFTSANVSSQLVEGWPQIQEVVEGTSSLKGSAEPVFHNPGSPLLFEQRQNDFLDKEAITSFASLPIMIASSQIGRLTILSRALINYSSRRRELLSLFISQAAFVLSNAQSHASADHVMSLQSDQLARLEEINRQFTSSSASDNLHEIILDHAVQATGADWGYLAMYKSETDKLHFVAYTGTSANKRRFRDEPQFEIHEGIFGRSYQTGQIINITSTIDDPQVTDPLGTNPQSVLCVPLCGSDQTLGVIGVESAQQHAFNGSHEEFLAQLAAYAANALYHAHIYNELQERLTEQSLLYQASTQIAESLESDAVGLAIADSLRVTVQADSASVYYWTVEGGVLQRMARIDGGRPSRDRDLSNPDLGKLLGHAQCLKDRVSMQWSSQEEVSDAEQEYLFTHYGKGRLLLLPLSVGERTLGIVEVYRKDIRPFSEAAIRSAQSIAIQASIALDNTELFRKISESHNRLSAILNSTREGFLLIDTDGMITIANKQMESLIDLQMPDLLKHPIDEPELELASRLGYHPQDLQNLATSLKEGRAQLAGTAIFASGIDSGKTYLRIDTPVYDLSNLLIGWLISLRDISEQKEIEDSREQLTEMIVHDLRSPLTTILNSILLLRRELEAQAVSSATEQAIAVADRSVNQMLGLVNSLLDISRLEAGKMKISPEDCLVRPLMQELQERFQFEANSVGVILNPVYADPEIRVSLDREKIQRVLANLLDNALKFTPAGGMVELGYSQEDGHILFWVSDTGPGIPPEFQEKIFERYIQIPGNTGRRRGTGLGLAFAKLAIEAHGGKLWVADNPDGGSIFKFSLPPE